MLFKPLGADEASVDAARVLRLVGTKNQKNNPEIMYRNVHVINREYFSKIQITLKGLIEELENTEPEKPEELNACISEWRQTLSKRAEVEADIIRPESEQTITFHI